jgi:hypothetical protein
MTHLGIGAEQFGIDAANFGIGLDTGNIGSVMAMAMATDSLNAQQEAVARPSLDVAAITDAAHELMNNPDNEHQRKEIESQLDAVMPERQPDIVPPATKPAKPVTKRKYTKRSK